MKFIKGHFERGINLIEHGVGTIAAANGRKSVYEELTIAKLGNSNDKGVYEIIGRSSIKEGMDVLKNDVFRNE